jgi:hypothetical protein
VTAITESTIFHQRLIIKPAGLLTPGVTLPEQVVVKANSFECLGVGAFGIFVLHLAADGSFTNAAEDSWIIPAKQTVPGRSLHPADFTAALGVEMVAILNTPRARMKDAHTGVNLRADGFSYNFADNQYQSAAETLGMLPPAPRDQILRGFQNSPDKSLRIWTAVHLLGAHVDIIEQIAPILMAPPPETQDAVKEFCLYFSWTRLPVGVTGTALMLLTSEAGNVRGAAASALANVPTPEIRQRIAGAIQTERDDEALHQEASALCRIMHDYVGSCGDVETEYRPLPDAFWRDWAQQQLKKPMPPPDYVNP